MQFDRAFFDAGIARRGTRSEKWDCADMTEGMLPLWVADMDFRCPPAVQQALCERAAHGCYGYTQVLAEDEDALRGFWQRRHGLEIAPGQTAMLPCVITGLRACVQALSEPGSPVITLSPVYGPFYRSILESGRRVADCPLRRGADGRYQMDLCAVEDALRAGARLMLLCSPHNPVSRLWSREELGALVALLKRYGARLVADEIHADFVYAPGEFTPILALGEAREMAVSLVSASKTFNLAGLQQAALVCMDGERLSLLRGQLQRAGVTSGNLFALAATRAAYEQGDAWLDGLLAYLDEGRAILKEELARALPGAALAPVEATYLAWIDLTAYAPDTKAQMALAKAGGVLLTPGTFFGERTGDGFVRLNFGCPHAMLREGVARLARAMRGE